MPSLLYSLVVRDRFSESPSISTRLLSPEFKLRVEHVTSSSVRIVEVAGT